MRQTLFILALLVQMLFVPQHAWSQSNYPIYVSPTLLPPYSLKLSDYSAYGSQRMMVTIVVNDLEVANLPVKLRVKMETAGVTIENPITINTTPIYIDGGSATILFGEDLTDYFNINNLQFKGYSKEAYRRSGQMPEGFYRFSVEVLHFHTNRVISNTGSVTAWIALGKPPVLRTPINDVELGQYMGVPLTFSWLASNVGSPVSAGSIRYKFEMWEVRVKGINPYTIVSSIPVFHEYATSSTSYSFNPASVMMEEGLTYAWQVTAYDESGLVPFEQNGQSEVRTFTYKSRCEEVQAVTAAASGQKGTFLWTPEKNHTSYNVEVRNSAADWFLANETFDSKVEFYELERGQTYELRVQAVCNGDANSVSDYSSWTALTIPKAQPKDNNDECPDCECSNDLPDVTLTNFELRHDLAPGDTLSNKTGTTRFIVKDAAYQGNGIYKGVFYFWAEIWGVKIPCDFWDLQVNTDNVIVNMDYKSINDPRFLLNIDALVETGNIFLDQVAVVITSYEIIDTIQVLQNFDYIVVQNGQLIAVVLDENGEPVETALNITAEEAEKVLITNEHGDEVVITSKGEVMGVKEYQATGGNSRLMQNYKEKKERNELSAGTMVNFAPHATQKYGFDRYTEQKSALQHLYPALHNGYRPAFKSVESFRYDKVGVDLTNGLSFRDEMGGPAVAMDGSVSVQGTQAGNNRAFYAYRALNDSTEELVGKLNVLSFDNAPKRVHIIPVNNAKIPSQSELQATLNRIYRQAIATWTVVPEAEITMEFPGGRMTHDGAGGLSTYNNDQKAIVDAYVASGRQMERDDLYLFFVEGATFKDRSLAGYMPLQRQVGFIYDYPSLETVAHELGHGAFNLRHTFSPKAFIAPEGQTPNLMDYAGGVEIWQEQWGMVQNPERILFGWAQSEEEGALVVEGTNLTISFKKINDDFEPGKKDLSIEYCIANLENIAKVHKDVTKAFIWIIKGGKTIYTSDLPLKNTNIFKWNGKSNQGETEAEIDGLSQFTIKIGVTILYNYSLTNIIEWLFTKDVDFKLTSEKSKNWIVLKWKMEFEELLQKNMQLVSETRYIERKEQYETRLESLGINTQETSPLEYLNEHLVAGDFLGQEIPSINIRFLYFLRKLEEELGRGKKWSQNSTTFNNYCILAPFIQDYARMSSAGSSISDHATGFAFDFDKDKNPYLENGNKYQDKLIQIVTGKKMLNMTYNVYSGNGIEEIKKVSNDFLRRIKDNDFDINSEELKSVYENISNYSDKVSLIKNDKSTEINNLISEIALKIENFVTDNPNILQNELEEKKQSIQDIIETTIVFFELYKTGMDELKILFDASQRGLFINYEMESNYEQLYSFISDYKAKANSTITNLKSIAGLLTGSDTAWNNEINTLKNNLSSISFSSDYQTSLTQFANKFHEKKNILGAEINEFHQKLKDETNGRNSYMGGKLFTNGFFGLDASLVKAIIQTKVTIKNEQMRLMWGGSYNSTKDIMHFELRKQAASSDRPWQKIVHDIDMKDIKEYLNSFTNKNGGNHDY